MKEAKEKCQYEKSWIGKCGKEAVNGFCEEHSKVKCCKCGKKATKECEHTSQFVCGAPLCKDCDHGHK